jgi:hypothetical protein
MSAPGSLKLFSISGSFRQKFPSAIDAVCVTEIASSRCALLAMTADGFQRHLHAVIASEAKQSLLPYTTPRSSWPGSSRPSTPSLVAKQGVDARHKAGHDVER